MIIDFHTHIFPRALAAHAIDTLQGQFHIPVYSDATRAGLIDSMQRAGIGMSVVQQVGTNPAKLHEINAYSAQRNGRDGIVYFAAIHPDCENVREELRFIASSGFAGIKLHPNFQRTPLDDIRYVRIIDYAGELGLAVLAHTGIDAMNPGEQFCTRSMMLRLCRSIGPTTFVLAHMGKMGGADAIGELLSISEHLYVDTAYSFGGEQLGKNLPYGLTLLSEEEFAQIVHAVGAQRIVFGSDTPWSDPGAYVRFVERAPLSDEERELIFCGNAKRILKLEQ